MSLRKTILVTGGAGYIGSHTIVELLSNDYEVVAVDNHVNSNPEAINRLRLITGKEIPFYDIDVSDAEALSQVFQEHSIDAVIHFAGLKAVGESTVQPLRYYQNNLGSTLSLCKVMEQHNVKNLVFSSSATVYGNPESSPITEDAPLSATNPYGQTKLIGEQILRDLAASDREWQITLLRYFNPFGAHPSGLIGEDPSDIPNNLPPYIAQVAIGRLEKLSIFGNDYPTPDGTGVRDYIHVTDLARGHIKALEHAPKSGVAEYNLGTGIGYSVLEVLRTFERVSEREIPFEFAARRPGDIATCYADAGKALQHLNWKTEYSLEQMCRDAWNWQTQNPNGLNKSK
jgi:UDP-glucose 4-epimerase